MSSYDTLSRQELVDQLLAPHRAKDRTRQSLLVRRLELARAILLRDLSDRISKTPIVVDSPGALREWLLLYFAGREREVFVALFLDNRHRLMASEELFQGTIDATKVYPREVVKQALRHNAAAVCIAHNHPSGCPEPSEGDRAVSRLVKEALAVVDIRLLDHFVVGATQHVSLAMRGWL